MVRLFNDILPTGDQLSELFKIRYNLEAGVAEFVL